MAKKIQQLTDLQPDPHNVNAGSQRGDYMLDKSLREYGAGRSILVDANGLTIAGNHVLEKAAEIGLPVQVIESDGKRLIVVQRTDLDLNDPTGAARKLALLDNRTTEAGLTWDADQLLQQINAGLDVSDLWFDDELATLLANTNLPVDDLTQPDEPGDAAPVEDDDPTVYAWEVPNALFPTDNDFDIPTLRLDMQATHLQAPLVMWGAGPRTEKTDGTIGFYVDDYRFTAIWKHPEAVVNTGCKAIIEPNLSCYPQTPRALVLWNIWQKRWVARWWQDYGIQTIVDLNIADEWADDNLLGVPKGWRAYACRAISNDDSLDERLQRAKTHAESDDVLFIVYGGEKSSAAWCKANNALYIPQYMNKMKDRPRQGKVNDGIK